MREEKLQWQRFEGVNVPCFLSEVSLLLVTDSKVVSRTNYGEKAIEQPRANIFELGSLAPPNNRSSRHV